PMSYIYQSHPHPAPHSFPTRRSSDLFSQGSTSGSSEPNEGARGTAGIPESGLGLGVPSKEPESIGAGTMEDPDSAGIAGVDKARSEEHTSELQSRGHLVCRLLLEKKK